MKLSLALLFLTVTPALYAATPTNTATFTATITNTPAPTSTSTPTPTATSTFPPTATATLTLAQARTRVDNRLTAVFPTVQAKETTYRASHGHYWQGLATTATLPVDGGDCPIDLAGRKPYYEIEAWADIFPGLLQASESAVFQIDVYDGPQGQGYVATVWVLYQGTVYTRAQNVGAETFRTYAWRAETDPEMVPR